MTVVQKHSINKGLAISTLCCIFAVAIPKNVSHLGTAMLFYPSKCIGQILHYLQVVLRHQNAFQLNSSEVPENDLMEKMYGLSFSSSSTPCMNIINVRKSGHNDITRASAEQNRITLSHTRGEIELGSQFSHFLCSAYSTAPSEANPISSCRDAQLSPSNNEQLYETLENVSIPPKELYRTAILSTGQPYIILHHQNPV